MTFNFLSFPWPGGRSGGPRMVITHILLNSSHIFKFQSLSVPIQVSFSYFCDSPVVVLQTSLSTTVTKGHSWRLLPVPWSPPLKEICCPLSHLGRVHFCAHAASVQGDNAEDCAMNAISFGIPRQPTWRCQSSSMFPGALNVPQLRPLQKVEKALPCVVFGHLDPEAVLLQEGGSVK